ncbi:c-type cytochrome [Roseateles amylovorans]|uniref:C-type cytochrome n=1 Tax=Roseateles amylovorans TaxID=2978473 RepID=A0ABY6AYR1_9BURK|nr:c-type cytochrome [Roseateles amylovorans]UXH78052.1 c-type cytochrome [Roseateles amylovorans]
MISLVLSSAAFAASPAGAPPADGAAPDAAQALRVKALAATCTACHGTDGRAVSDPAVPGLAGRSAADLEAQILAYKRGERPGTVMPQIAKGYDEAQIRAIARYFAAQSMATGRSPSSRGAQP